MIEYEKSSIVINIDAKNNLYFKYLSPSVADFMYYNVLLNKWYPIVSMTIAATFAILAEIFRYFIDEYYGFLFLCIGYITVFMITLSYAFSANIEIVYLIIQTFDFWFKLWNLVLFAISILILFNYGIYHWPAYFQICVISTTLCIFCVLFIIDSINIANNKVKNGIIIFIAMYCVYQTVQSYFTDPDILYNPFQRYDIDESQISFKSVFMSSLTNLGLFIMKPVLSKVAKKILIQSKICNFKRMQNAGPNNNAKYDRCGLIYKRPKLHWNNKKKATTVTTKHNNN